MNKEKIDELMEYNLEYLEARNSEDIFGGDYTSSVGLKYANKTIDKLQQENEQLKDNWNKLKEWLKEYDIANEKWFNNELTIRDRKYYENQYLDCKFWVNKFIYEMQELESGDKNE